MYFEQDLFGKRLSLAIGRLSTGDDFATSDLSGNYVSAGVNGNPFTNLRRGRRAIVLRTALPH
jgi:hypothetical protein